MASESSGISSASVNGAFLRVASAAVLLLFEAILLSALPAIIIRAKSILLGSLPATPGVRTPSKF